MRIFITALIIPVRGRKGWWVWVPDRNAHGVAHAWDGKALSNPGALGENDVSSGKQLFSDSHDWLQFCFFQGSLFYLPGGYVNTLPLKLLAPVCSGSLTLVPKPLFWPRQNQLHSLASAFISEQACDAHKGIKLRSSNWGAFLARPGGMRLYASLLGLNMGGCAWPRHCEVCQSRNGAMSQRRGALSLSPKAERVLIRSCVEFSCARTKI